MMYLAAHLGHPSPTRMLGEMTPLDYALWREYASSTPFGEIREDARHGIRAALFVRSKSKKGAKISPSDFVPKFKEKTAALRKRMSWQEQLAFVEILNLELGGKDLRNKPS